MGDKILIKIKDTHTDAVYYPDGTHVGKIDYSTPVGITLDGLVIYKTDMDKGNYLWNIDRDNRFIPYLINES